MPKTKQLPIIIFKKENMETLLHSIYNIYYADEENDIIKENNEIEKGYFNFFKYLNENVSRDDFIDIKEDECPFYDALAYMIIRKKLNITTGKLFDYIKVRTEINEDSFEKFYEIIKNFDNGEKIEFSQDFEFNLSNGKTNLVNKEQIEVPEADGNNIIEEIDEKENDINEYQVSKPINKIEENSEKINEINEYQTLNLANKKEENSKNIAVEISGADIKNFINNLDVELSDNEEVDDLIKQFEKGNIYNESGLLNDAILFHKQKVKGSEKFKEYALKKLDITEKQLDAATKISYALSDSPKYDYNDLAIDENGNVKIGGKEYSYEEIDDIVNEIENFVNEIEIEEEYIIEEESKENNNKKEEINQSIIFDQPSISINNKNTVSVNDFSSEKKKEDKIEVSNTNSKPVYNRQASTQIDINNEEIMSENDISSEEKEEEDKIEVSNPAKKNGTIIPINDEPENKIKEFRDNFSIDSKNKKGMIPDMHSLAGGASIFKGTKEQYNDLFKGKRFFSWLKTWFSSDAKKLRGNIKEMKSFFKGNGIDYNRLDNVKDIESEFKKYSESLSKNESKKEITEKGITESINVIETEETTVSPSTIDKQNSSPIIENKEAQNSITIGGKK